MKSMLLARLRPWSLLATTITLLAAGSIASAENGMTVPKQHGPRPTASSDGTPFEEPELAPTGTPKSPGNPRSLPPLYEDDATEGRGGLADHFWWGHRLLIEWLIRHGF